MPESRLNNITDMAGAPRGYGGPFLSLDIPVTESPVKTDGDMGETPSLPLHAHPDTVNSLAQTLMSTFGLAFGSMGAGLHSSIGTTLEFGIGGLAALARHENAHAYVLYRNGVKYFQKDDLVFTDALVNIAGINANLTAADRLPLEPYEGPMSDLNEIAATIDLPAYYLFQEKLGLQFGDGKGDLGKTEDYLEGRGLKNSEALTATLGLWQALDLFWWKDAPVIRALNFAMSGKGSKNPYAPGSFALKSTATLSPVGHMGGLAAYYFLDGRTKLPSAVTAKIEASPARRDDTIFPFMLSADAKRIPLPLKVGPVDLAMSGGLTMSAQDTEPFIDDPEMNSGIITFAGRTGLHFQLGRGEISFEARYKQKGFIPNEGFKEEFSVWSGLNVGLGN